MSNQPRRRHTLLTAVPLAFLVAIIFTTPGCIMVGWSSASKDREMMISTSERVRKLESRMDVVELTSKPDSERRLVERILRLERELDQLREENKRLSEQVSGDPEE
ncbi:MAG: hypothetical protein JJU11_04900 [Candidatus Sumerlaeia bacterium]|nr:hypothetical protein [Candidatus Sumerlaeia bacterium]